MKKSPKFEEFLGAFPQKSAASPVKKAKTVNDDFGSLATEGKARIYSLGMEILDFKPQEGGRKTVIFGLESVLLCVDARKDREEI